MTCLYIKLQVLRFIHRGANSQWQFSQCITAIAVLTKHSQSSSTKSNSSIKRWRNVHISYDHSDYGSKLAPL